jgi:hypothetical protein
LPHDDDLLGQIMLTIEISGRPWPKALPEGWPPWPALLGPDPHRYAPPMDEEAATEPPPPPRLGRAERRELAALMRRLEVDFMERRRCNWHGRSRRRWGRGSTVRTCIFSGGLASEEGGDGPRARAHLALVAGPGAGADDRAHASRARLLALWMERSGGSRLAQPSG